MARKKKKQQQRRPDGSWTDDDWEREFPRDYILACCAAIQAGWSAAERVARRNEATIGTVPLFSWRDRSA